MSDKPNIFNSPIARQFLAILFLASIVPALYVYYISYDRYHNKTAQQYTEKHKLKQIAISQVMTNVQGQIEKAFVNQEKSSPWFSDWKTINKKNVSSLPISFGRHKQYLQQNNKKPKWLVTKSDRTVKMMIVQRNENDRLISATINIDTIIKDLESVFEEDAFLHIE